MNLIFLMENLWWPGLTLTRPEITRRLLDKIHYPKKGIMLDTGHLMHTNLELAAQEEAVDYILDMVRAHSDMIPYMKGIHLNQSLTGQYVKDLLKKRDEMPKTHKERVSALSLIHILRSDNIRTGKALILRGKIRSRWHPISFPQRPSATEKLR